MSSGRNLVTVVRAKDVSSDARSQRTVRWLADAGYSACSLSWPRGGRGTPPDWPDVEFVQAPFSGEHGAGIRNLLPLARWSWWLFWTLWRRRRRLVAIHAMDLDTALPCWMCARLSRAKFVYDICDFYSVSRFPTGPALLARLAHRMEMFFVKRSDAVVIPAESRRALFGKVQPPRLTILANVPPQQPSGLKPKDADRFTVLYVGVLSVRRGLRELVEVVAGHADWQLVLGGIGEDEVELRGLAEGHENVQFIGKIPYSEVLEYTSVADVLPITYDPSFPNHRHSSPNKLYEAMMVGVPVVVARNTGVDDDVARHDLGEVVEYGNAAELDDALTKLANRTDQQREQFRIRTTKLFHDQFGPDIMSKRLRDMYEEVCGRAK